MANPTLLTQPFAANGDKNIIPNTTTTQGAFSQDKGFPAECSMPLGAGGVAPSRQDMNGAFNMLSTIMYYAQKGYTWHWDAGQEYFAGCVVIDDTDGKMYQCVQDVAAGRSVPSTDGTNWKKFSTGGGGKSVGEIVLRAWGEANVGELMCNGAEISRAMYPDYAQWSAEHNYPWGAGDGATTVNLPNLIGRFPEGATSAGGYHEAGLPNVEGEFSASHTTYNPPTFSGGFSVENDVFHSMASGSEGTNHRIISFDASRSNPIYGNSATVQPASALLIPYVVVFTDQTADSALIDVTQYAEALNGKANRALTNVESNVDFVVESYHDAEGNWYRKYKSGWVEQGGVAVANGSNNSLNQAVTLLKPMADNKYTVMSTICSNVAYTSSSTSSWTQDSLVVRIGSLNSKTSTAFCINRISANSSGGTGDINWRVEGQGANV